MIIGCVKEIKNEEFRVGLTPDAVYSYVNEGHKVLIEKGAGLGSSFSDEEYVEAGAELKDTAKEVWDACEMMVKVKEPIESEYKFFHEGLILYTYLHLAADKPLTDALVESKVQGVAYETVVGRNGKGLPLLSPMSYVAGRLSIQEGEYHLKKQNGGRGILLGGVPGTKAGNVVVVGGGTVGTQAALMAVGTGARVTILESNHDRIAELNAMFGNSVQVLYSSAGSIAEAVSQADLVVSCVLIPGAKAPKLIRREHLKTMKKGAVIVDVAIDQGGTTEMSHATTHDEPTFMEDGIVMYCVANMPGAVPNTSTIALNNSTLFYGLKIAKLGVLEAAKQVPGLKEGINTYDGKVTFKGVAEATGYDYVAVDEL